MINGLIWCLTSRFITDGPPDQLSTKLGAEVGIVADVDLDEMAWTHQTPVFVYAYRIQSGGTCEKKRGG